MTVGPYFGAFGSTGGVIDVRDQRFVNGRHPDAELTSINPAVFAELPVPPRRWLVKDLIPEDAPTLLSGDGGSGKSTLVLQLSVARALGKNWLGLLTRPGRTVYWSAEDDMEELHRRLAGIVRHYGSGLGDLADIRLFDRAGQDAVLAALNRSSGRIERTKLFESMMTSIIKFEPSLVVIDSLADAFVGDEIARQHARQFIQLMAGACRHGNFTIIILAHPSESGMASGTGKSGSTHWHNSVRARLYFERDPQDNDKRILSNKKSNYGPIGISIPMRYCRGAFVELEAIAPEQREKTADDEFRSLLAYHKVVGLPVGPNRGSNYAPAVFAKCQANTMRLSARDFVGAMERLLALKVIRIVEDGPPSRRRVRLDFVGGAA